jgi:hypothetical protein
MDVFFFADELAELTSRECFCLVVTLAAGGYRHYYRNDLNSSQDK